MTDEYDIGLHEILDRTSIIVENLDRFVSNAPVMGDHPDLKSKVDHIIEQLADLYQEIGAKTLGGDFPGIDGSDGDPSMSEKILSIFNIQDPKDA